MRARHRDPAGFRPGRAAVIVAGLFAALLFLAGITAEAGSAPLAGASALDRSEASLGRSMGNYRLLDQDGAYLPVSTLRGKAVVLNFMYADCMESCLLISESIAGLGKSIPPAIAEKTVFLSVSIDPADSAEKLREMGQRYTAKFDNWIFARTDPETLALMTSDLGFYYSPRGSAGADSESSSGGFDHMNRLTVLDPAGRVTAHFYGTEFDPAEVTAALSTALGIGQPGAAANFLKAISSGLRKAVDTAQLYCSQYDPVTRTYRVDYFYVAVWVVQYGLIAVTAVYFFRHRQKWFGGSHRHG